MFIYKYYNPTVLSPDEIHAINCVEINKRFDAAGLPNTQRVRGHCHADAKLQGNCPIEHRPSETSPNCPEGRFLNGTSIKWPDPDDRLGPCCTTNKHMTDKADKDTPLDTLEDIAHHHPVIAGGVTGFITYRMGKWAMKGAIAGGKAIAKDGVKETGAQIGKALKNKVMNLGPEAIAKITEKKAATKLAGEKLTSAVTDIIIKRSEESMLKRLGESIAKKMSEMTVLGSIPIIGWGADMFMAMGMVADVASPQGTQFNQYQSNRDYLDQRDMIEGNWLAMIGDMTSDDSDANRKPLYFTLNMLDSSSVIYKKNHDKFGEAYAPFMEIHSAFKDAISSWGHKLVADTEDPESENYISEVWQNKLDDYFDAITQNPDDDTIEIPQDVIDHITAPFHRDFIKRDQYIYDSMIASKYLKPEYHDYFTEPDPEISSETVHSITLSYPKGYDEWNKFVRTIHGGASLPMAVYSKYYRVLDPNNPPRPGTKDDPIKKSPRHILQGELGGINVEGDIDELSSGITSGPDLSGQMVYTLKTMTLNKPVMQYSYAKTHLDIKCRHGMHMPTLASMLMGIADEKLCEHSGKKYTRGSCSDPEFAMNDTECSLSGATWTPPVCGEGDDTTGNLLDTQSTIAKDTVKKAADKLAPPEDGENAEDRKLHESLYAAFGTQVGDGSGNLNEDVFPSYFGVGYNDDTGICVFNSGTCSDPDYASSKDICENTGGGFRVGPGAVWTPNEHHSIQAIPVPGLALLAATPQKLNWCDRMGMESYSQVQDPSFEGTDLVYQDCQTSLMTDVVSFLFGKTFGAEAARFISEGEDILEDITGMTNGIQAGASALRHSLPEEYQGSGSLGGFIEHPIDRTEVFFEHIF